MDVKNSGLRAGDDVVQMYAGHLDSKVERPIKELKGFKRVSLKSDEKKTVTFPLKARDLAYWNVTKGAWDIEADHVSVIIASSSVDIRLRATIEVTR